MRHSDIKNLKWKNLSSDNKFFKIQIQKTGKYSSIPLNEDALKVIEDRKGDNDNVVVDNGDSLMKMLVYGKNMVIADHGDGTKIASLPAVISQRYKNAWSDVDFVEVHRGHLHTNKSAKFAAIEELAGITVRNLSSMSATDYWHDSKGFIGNIKKAQSFLYHRINGLQCIMNYNVEIN